MREWTGKKRGSSEEAVEVSRLNVGTPTLKQGRGLARTPRRPTVQDSRIECEGDGGAGGGQLQDFWWGDWTAAAASAEAGHPGGQAAGWLGR